LKGQKMAKLERQGRLVTQNWGRRRIRQESLKKGKCKGRKEKMAKVEDPAALREEKTTLGDEL